MTARSATDPFLLDFDPASPIGWRSGNPVSIRRFLAKAASLAGRLPHDGYCINACEDRLNFLVGLAAALMTRSITLLPQSRAPNILRDLAADYAGAYRLVDSGAAWHHGAQFEIGPWPEGGVPANRLEFPRSRIAVILFTSGTTGTPRPQAKTWGSLVAGARALRARVPEVAGATLLGAVPPQHMWGLESTVMLAIQSGCAVHPGCPLLPAEIAKSLAGIEGRRWLVATPLHLRACVASGDPLPEISGVLCSTAPLAQDTARRMEDLGQAAVIEIYGSTETGALATRRTACTPTFEAIAGVEITIADHRATARGGHLAAQIELNDILVAKGPATFDVQGRAIDLVKIGGKRSSLAFLNAELNRLPGVVDGVFWLPETGAATTRPMAFVVAPGVDRATVLAGLRDRIDPAFMPRPLVLVGELPRNAAGKLTRDAMMALADAVPKRGAAHRIGGTASDWQRVPASHPALSGHFPGNPVVPGVWLLALAESAVRKYIDASLRIVGVPAASFRAPLRPEERFRIVLDRVAPNRVAFRIEGDSSVIADGAFQVDATP